MPSSSPAMPPSSTRTHLFSEALLPHADKLPQTIMDDIITLLDEGEITTLADLQVIINFVKAAQSVCLLPQFKARRNDRKRERHCVLCHGTFTNESNDKWSCTIPHAFITEPERCGRDGFCYDSACCGSRVQLFEEGFRNDCWIDLDRLGNCYEGYHTDDIDEAEECYNDVNILPCKKDDKGICTRTVVDEEPAFEWHWDNDD